MKNRVIDVRQLWVGCILLSTAMSGFGVTLGRHSGAGVIGRPLDIRVQALLSQDEDPSGLCINADVFYGDTQVSSSAVRTSVQRTSPDAAPSVRVQSSVAIDEPIVTVYVRAGCSTPFTRRYVLLADPITEPAKAQAAATPSTVVATASLPSVPAVVGLPLPAATGRAVDSGSQAAALNPQQRQDAAAETPGAGPVVAPQKSKPRRVAKPVKPSVAASVVRRSAEPVADLTPRLVLDPVDVSLAIERDPVLKLSLTLLSEPTTSDEVRAAAGLLWKSINASPEDRLRDARKLEVLEAEAKGLRAEEIKDKATISALSADLEQSRYLTWLVYLLGVLLLLALLSLLFLWRRQKQNQSFEAAKAWWASEEAQKLEKGHSPAKRSGAAPLDLDLGLEQDSVLSDLNSLPALSEMAGDPSKLDMGSHPSNQLPSRALATEELFDVQQQADFFCSLGEFDQAIQVLRNNINEKQTPSALVYLDLFKLYHQLGRQADYEHLREEFNQVFNAGAPPFEQYSDESLGLEAYETAFGRIQALWPEPRVLDVIEKSIFREPGDEGTEVFDLEAYRELLLLHSVAKEVIHREAVESAFPKDFQNTKVQPLKASGKVVAPAVGASRTEGGETVPMEQVPPASSKLGLDVNLDDMSEFSAFEASLPEVDKAVEPTSKPMPPLDHANSTSDENMIDFEVLDFMAPDEDERKPPESH